MDDAEFRGHRTHLCYVLRGPGYATGSGRASVRRGLVREQPLSDAEEVPGDLDIEPTRRKDRPARRRRELDHSDDGQEKGEAPGPSLEPPPHGSPDPTRPP